ncbi:MAG: nucleoside triphosphate pyrophosphohydrolase family protein [Myxococcota bacterium]
MRFSEYQALAAKTDQAPEGETAKMLPMLGLAGEAGSVLTVYKKYLRDGRDQETQASMREELGDVLWYVATIASKFGLDLDEVAANNIDKVNRWWGPPPDRRAFDGGFPIWEQLPSVFEVEMTPITVSKGTGVRLTCDMIDVGDRLTDNAHVEDGYRFHDIFHFAYAAILGWSPVTRSIFGLKRKSRPTFDEVEDGGRAIVVEEGISAYVFACAWPHRFDAATEVERSVLNTIRTMVNGLEVAECTEGEWQQAILEGFRVFRAIADANGGLVKVNTLQRHIDVVRVGPP